MDLKNIAEQAYELLEPSIKKLLKEKAKREDMHIVVMNPAVKPWEASFEEAILAEFSLTDKSGWANPYDDLARGKAKQAWRDGKSNVHKHLIAPATLKTGDVAFYGSFEHEGVIVGASGVEGWYDVLVCGLMAVAIQQLAQAEYQKFKSENPMSPYLD
ncbi:MAG: hypothetical protein PQJ59_04230 [Spirochaetales bacterium]|nr:hypothetical protein [Spirochaetales bacterium]